jgi:glycosyltransferase involved in cell wall biosynthesis
MDAPGEPKRVAWLIKGLGPGGAERLLFATAAAMERARFSIDVYYLMPEKRHLTPDFHELGIPTTCLNVRDERDLRWVLQLRRHLTEKHFHIVHAHSPYVASFARIVTRTLPRSRRPRVVTTEHNPWSTFKTTTRFANALTSPLSDVTIAVSEEVRASMSPPMQRRSETLTHGIDIDAARSQLSARVEARRELGIADDVFLVGTVANYHPKKDWPNLLRAARLVHERKNSVRFCAVGQGPLEAQVKELHAELELDDIVILTGYRPDAVRLMAGCDAFVLASQWEGMPVALMEACALSLPVIATAVGGIPEVFRAGQDALLVPPGNSEALAAAVVEVATNPELQASLRRASTCLARAFDARRAVRRIEQIYDEQGP